MKNTELENLGVKCPVCGYPTLGERAMCEICPICSWEDCGFSTEVDYLIPKKNFYKFLDYGGENGGSTKPENQRYIELRKNLINLYSNNSNLEEIEKIEKNY